MSDNNYGDHNFGVFSVNETSVGKGGQNSRRSDIQLVQFFLRDFLTVHPELIGDLPTTKNGLRPVSIDGRYGKQTEKAILIFQKWIQSQGMPIKTDGLVSVAHSMLSPISGAGYTIMHLNVWFQKYGKDKEYHGRLEHNHEINAYAPELNTDLTIKNVTSEF